MAWIESHASLREHPKTKRLCRLLKLNRREAVGLLHFLWWWALDYLPEGDLSGVSDDDIADAVDWKRDAGELVAALTLAGFLDEGRLLHDWQDYAGRWIDRRAANAERKRVARAARGKTGRPGDVQRTSHESQQLPDLNRTGPNRTLTGPPTQTLPATEREGLSGLAPADSQGDETGEVPEVTAVTASPVQAPPNGAGKVKPVLNGRSGWAGCPAGCPTNHGGPSAAKHLAADWLEIPTAERPRWSEYLAKHGRSDLADVPAPSLAPAQQEG